MTDRLSHLQMCYERKELAKFLKIVALVRQTKSIDSSTATKEFHGIYEELLQQIQADAYSTNIVDSPKPEKSSK